MTETNTAQNKSSNLLSNRTTGSTGKTGDLKVHLFDALDKDNMTELEGIMWLRRRHEEKEQEIAVDEMIEGFPLDALQCFARVLAETYGFTSLESTQSMFGSSPPRMLSLRKSINEADTIQVPWGKMSIPGIEGSMSTSIGLHKGQPVLRICATIKRKNEAEIHNLLNSTRELLSSYSIYQGKAVKVNFQNIEDLEALEKTPIEDFAPEYIRTTTNGLDNLIFNDKVQRQIDTSLFLPIRKTQRCRDNRPEMLNRGILLAGPPGTGKSLTATFTAKLCVENGWTFVLCQAKNLKEAYQFAGRYQPSVVFCEDIDQVLGNLDPKTGEEIRGEKIDEYLNAMDSVDTKDREIITVCTTNHIDKLGPTVLRHGRFHNAIPVLPPDIRTIEKLVRYYAKDRLPHAADIYGLCEMLYELNSIPASIQEVVNRAEMCALADTDDNNDQWYLSEQDLITSAEGMADHMSLLTPKPVDTRSDIEKAADSVGRSIVRASGKNLPESKNGKSTNSRSISLASEAVRAFGIQE